MSNASNVALAFLVGQNASEQAVKDRIAALETENARLALERSKTAKPKVKKAGRPIHEKGNPSPMNTVHGIALPEQGTLDPAGFMQAMKDAGKRTVHMMSEVVEGKTRHYTVPQATDTSHIVTRVEHDKVRDDQIKAIAAFVGYDNRRNFGEQEAAARMLAQRKLGGIDYSKGLSREESHKADLSAKGFVAGLPAPVAAKLADLRGREVIAADAMIGHEKAAADENRTADERELSAGMVEVERERLKSIRSDIRALTFDR
jgi:hypothetical protein